MEILVILMIPGLIVFDFIPMLLGRKGLSQWYVDKYNTEADILVIVVYIPFLLLIGLAIYFYNI